MMSFFEEFEINFASAFDVKMRFVFILLTIFAVLLTILIVGLTILSIIVGGGNILLPGLGIVVSLPFIIFLLVVIDTVIIACALACRRLIGKPLP